MNPIRAILCLLVLLALTAAAKAVPSSPAGPCRTLPAQAVDLLRGGLEEVVLEDKGVLAAGESTAYRVYLVAGRMYGLMVGGCEDALDIDVTVQGPRGELIAGDNDDSRRAALALMPERTGMYTVTVTMWKAHKGGGHYAMSIAHGQ